jgi:hypothetical protein
VFKDAPGKKTFFQGGLEELSALFAAYVNSASSAAKCAFKIAQRGTLLCCLPSAMSGDNITQTVGKHACGVQAE